MMHQKNYVLLIASLLVLAIAVEVLSAFNLNPYTLFNQVIYFFAFVSGLGLMVDNGTIFKHKPLSRLISIAIGLEVLAVIMRLLHLPFNQFFFVITLSIVGVIYQIHFFKKPQKKLLDYFKVLWLTFFVLALIFETNHFPLGREFSLLSVILFYLTYTVFTIKTIQAQKNKS